MYIQTTMDMITNITDTVVHSRRLIIRLFRQL